MDKKLDQFYTRPHIAAACWAWLQAALSANGIDGGGYHYIEPSAGAGVFYDLLPSSRRLAIDIQPARADITQADFMTWRPPQGNKYIVVGNPPFGLQGATARAFIARASLFADICAFVLPRSAAYDKKNGGIKIQHGIYRLAAFYGIGGKAFHTPNGKGVDIRGCTFAIYNKGDLLSAAKKQAAATCFDYADIYNIRTYPRSPVGIDKIKHCHLFLPEAVRDETALRAYDNFGDLPYPQGFGIVLKKDKARLRRYLCGFDFQAVAGQNANRSISIKKTTIAQAITAGGFIDKVLI